MDEAGTSWHTPGHNAGHAFSRSLFLQGFRHEYGAMTFRADLSVSVHSLGDLSTPESRTPLADAQRLTSEIFGSAQSCYITNGSTTSNKAMLMTLLRPGETVLLDRNCHKSVHHAVVMAGAIPNSSSGRKVSARLSRRSTTRSPSTTGMVDMRTSSSRSPTRTRAAPSWGRRFSAMSMCAMTFRRETRAASRCLGGAA